MDPIFDRGDYRTFVVVAPKGNLDNPLFAFPVFEDQKVSEVFDYYVKTYVPSKAKIKRRPNDCDDPLALGYVFADITSGVDTFSVSTILERHMLWKTIIPLWEDQWVFDHLRFIGEKIPANTTRHLMGSTYTQSQVRDHANAAFNRFMLITLTLYTAFIFTRNNN